MAEAASEERRGDAPAERTHEAAPPDRDGAGGGKRVELVVITGYSGAGKSEAIAAFEDGGYFCVDNLPPRMIEGLGELFQHEGSGVEKAAVVTDVRGGDTHSPAAGGSSTGSVRSESASRPCGNGRTSSSTPRRSPAAPCGAGSR